MQQPEFYPRDLWQHSAVYNSFVKLFCKDIHSLQRNPAEGKDKDSTRFWLNHPIRWVQAVGIIVAITQKEEQDVILLDDSSGETVELVVTEEEHRRIMPNYEEDGFQERLWKRRRKEGRLRVGILIKVKGEIREKWKVRKIGVMKLDILRDQNAETKAWEERVAFKRTVLSKPWVLPSSMLANSLRHKDPLPTEPTSAMEQQFVEKKSTRHIDFRTLPQYAHSIRNLKLLLLSHIRDLQRFTPTDLFAVEDIQYASVCVARHDLPKGFTERDVTNTLLAALNLLLRDGNIIIPKLRTKKDEITMSAAMEETFIVVGTWNLASMIKSAANKSGTVVVRDVWKKVVGWGNGWDGTTKGVIGVVVEDVLMGMEGQEWVESRSGVWTRLDV